MMAQVSGRNRCRIGFPLLAALTAGACGTGGTTGPSEAAAPPAAPTSFATWTGSAAYSRLPTPAPTGFFNTYFEGTVTWQKETAPPPGEDFPVPAGAVRYRVASGVMHVVVRGIRTFLLADPFSCADEGAADVALGPSDAPFLFPDDPPRSALDVFGDGRYVGWIYKPARVPWVRTCGDQRFPSTGEVTMSLQFTGTLNAARHIQGTMTEASSFETETGSWDFSGR